MSGVGMLSYYIIYAFWARNINPAGQLKELPEVTDDNVTVK